MEREYVGVDLHRRRSVIYRMNAAGEKLSCVRVAMSRRCSPAVISAAAPGADVVIEATYGWYWAADLVAEDGACRHPASRPNNPQPTRQRARDATPLLQACRSGAWLGAVR